MSQYIGFIFLGDDMRGEGIIEYLYMSNPISCKSRASSATTLIAFVRSISDLKLPPTSR